MGSVCVYSGSLDLFTNCKPEQCRQTTIKGILTHTTIIFRIADLEVVDELICLASAWFPSRQPGHNSIIDLSSSFSDVDHQSING